MKTNRFFKTICSLMLTAILFAACSSGGDDPFVGGGAPAVDGDPTAGGDPPAGGVPATFSDAAKLAYYSVDNPATGNKQLVVYDGVTGKQTVVKDNVIIGGRAFVLEGAQIGDKTAIAARKYGIFLDPNQSRETRTAPDGRGGSFQYEFFFDNAFKRYDVATPSNEALIFDASMLSPFLKDQGIKRLSGQYTLHNNIGDPDNSYVDLIAFQQLPDPLRGETADDRVQAPHIVRLVDGRMTQGRTVRILKGADGRTQNVLINFIPVHTPAGPAPARRLQRCAPDLSGCADVGGGEGNFFFLAESDSHIYLGKDGDAAVHAFDKAASSLTPVNGAAYPAPFNPNVHLLEVGGAHGSGGILNDFSALSGPNRFVSDGPNAYLAIHYDLDTQDPVGEFPFAKIKIFKHARIVKLTGTTGMRMFDNGDGVDHGDGSDAEPAVGHLNLIAVSNGRLFVESGNYDGGPGGSCTPAPGTGFGCSSVRYGYLNTDSADKTAFDVLLQEKTGLRYFTARRIAPVAMNGKLLISILEKDAVSGVSEAVYGIHVYALDTVVEEATSVGRTAMTKTAERANGVFDGEILAWDAVSGELRNVTRNELVLGNATALSADTPAINSVFGRTRGVPLSGIGTLYALRAHNGDHRWHLLAGEVDAASGLVYIDQVPTSAWLYD